MFCLVHLWCTSPRDHIRPTCSQILGFVVLLSSSLAQKSNCPKFESLSLGFTLSMVMFSWKAYRQKMNGFWNDDDFRCSRPPAQQTTTPSLTTKPSTWSTTATTTTQRTTKTSILSMKWSRSTRVCPIQIFVPKINLLQFPFFRWLVISLLFLTSQMWLF